MFSLSLLAIFSTIALSPLTSALPPSTPVGDLRVTNVSTVTGIASTVPVVTSLGSRDVPLGVVPILTVLKTCLMAPAAAAKQPGATEDMQVNAMNEMQDCIHDAANSVQALHGQPLAVILAPAAGTGTALATAEEISEILVDIINMVSIVVSSVISGVVGVVGGVVGGVLGLVGGVLGGLGGLLGGLGGLIGGLGGGIVLVGERDAAVVASLTPKALGL
ncbi:hypothetical protein OH76DRAFT_256172 [Lentinus brumalis]|uniref:Uncharacterized protein n=1 Tax=Lentinus brumalis TaxID=2498619 RepID=A0A371CL86_9APHY|nr:hypothetical protein OH76DRAFT_256172 [Polyporus brumalis]